MSGYRTIDDDWLEIYAFHEQQEPLACPMKRMAVFVQAVHDHGYGQIQFTS